jgi:ribosomal protein S14
MKYLKKKDNKNRIKYKNHEIKIKIYKFLFKNQVLDKKLKFFFFKKYLLLKKQRSISKIKNRCILTFRGGSYIRDFQLSRISLKRWYSEGNLYSLKKSSW